MTEEEFSRIPYLEIRGSLPAMLRAAEDARRIAIQTGTAIVIVKEGRIVHVTAEELLQQERARAESGARPASAGPESPKGA
jgi:hypothetical protein